MAQREARIRFETGDKEFRLASLVGSERLSRVYTLQVRAARGRRIQRWALPHSLAVTRGILVSFLSSA